MNPFSTLPLFMALTPNSDEKSRRRVALAACLYAFALLMAFLFLGTAIIDFFGISVPGIRIAGGLIISVIGFRMLFPGGTRSRAPARGRSKRMKLPSRRWPCPAWPAPDHCRWS